MKRIVPIVLAIGFTGALCITASAFEGYGGNTFLADADWNFATVDGNISAVPAGEGSILKIAREKEGADYLLEGQVLTCLVRGEDYDYIYEYDLKERHREVLLALNKGSAFLGKDGERLYYIEAGKEESDDGILGCMDLETLEVTEYTEGVKAAVYDGQDLFALVQPEPEKKTEETDEEEDETQSEEGESAEKVEETAEEVLPAPIELIRIDPVKGSKRKLKSDCGTNLLMEDKKVFFDLADGTLCMLEEGRVQEKGMKAMGARYLYAEGDLLYLRKADGDFAFMDLAQETIKTWETPSGTTPERIRDQGNVFWYADDVLYDADFGILWKAENEEELLGLYEGKKIILEADGTVRRV